MNFATAAAAVATAVAAAIYVRSKSRRRYHRWWNRPTLPDFAPITVGVIGCANIAKKNVRAMTLIPNVRCVAVASRSINKARAWVEELQSAGVDVAGIQAMEGYEVLLANKTIDAVYIPLPTSMHLAWVERAVAHGKHVLLEKPIALSKADAQRIVDLCANAGVQLMDGTMFVHNPRQRGLIAAMAEDGFGGLRRINSAFSFPGDAEFNSTNIRVKKDLDGLGCLGDLGWYNVRASLEAVGYRRPSTVQGHAGARRNAEGVLVDCGATLTWACFGGLSASFDCSFRCGLRQTLELVGGDGTIELDDFVLHSDPHGPWCGFNVTHGANIGDYACDVGGAARRERRTCALPLPQEALMWAAFGRCVRAIRDEGAAPVAQWPERTMLTQEIICAVQESLDNGCKLVAM